MELPIVSGDHVTSVAYGPMGPPISLEKAKIISGAVAAIFGSSGMGKPSLGATCEDGGNSAVCGNDNFLVIVRSEKEDEDSRIRVELHTTTEQLIGNMTGENTKLTLLFMQFPSVVETVIDMTNSVEQGDNTPKIFAIPLDIGNKKVTKGKSVEEVLEALGSMNINEDIKPGDLN